MATTGDEAVEVSVGATIDDAVAAIAKLTDQFAQFSKETTEHLNAVSEAMGTLGEKVLGALEAFASIEGLKHAIEATQEFARETESLAARMGTTQAAASQFILGLEDVGVSAEQAGGIMQRMQRQLKSNEQGLNDLGLKTRDAAGQLRPLQELFQDSIEVLGRYKEGTDRNQAAMVIFGGRVGDITRLLKANREEMAKVAARADALGLTMTKEAAAGAEGFRKALAELHEVALAFYKVIGDALMPVLASIIKEFTDSGPAAVAIFGAAFKGLVTVFDTAWLVVQQFLTLVRLAVQTLTVFSLTIKDVLANAFSPTAAVAAFKQGMQQIEDIYAQTNKDLEANQAAFLERLKNRYSEGTKGGAPQGGLSAPDLKARQAAAAALDEQIKHAQALLAQEEERLRQEVQAKRLTEDQKAVLVRAAQDHEYETEKALIEKKAGMYVADKEKKQQALSELAALEDKHTLDTLKAVGAEAEAKLKASQKELADQRTMGEAVTKLVDKGIKDRAALETSAIEARLKMTDAGYKQEVAYLDKLVQTGAITATRKLEIERELLNSVYEAKRAEVARERDIAQTTEAETVKQHQEVDQKLAQLDAQHLTDLQTNTNATLKAIGERWKQVFDVIGSAFSTTIKGIILGTTTWRQGFSNILQSIVGEFINFCAKLAEEWLLMQLKKTYATIIGTQERTAAEATGAAESSAIQLPHIIASILNFAQQTFAGVFAFLSSFMGPAALGPATEAAGTVAGAAGLLSAAGGYDVPAGVNPLTQLHAKEMVLPAALADRVRNGSAGGGGNLPAIHIHSMDSRDVERALQRGGALDKAMKQLLRQHGVSTGRR